MKKILMVASNDTAFNGFCGLVNSIHKFIPEYEYYFTIIYQNCNHVKELMIKHELVNRVDVEFINFQEQFNSTYDVHFEIIKRAAYHTSLGKYIRYKERVRQIREIKDKLQEWIVNNNQDIVLLYGDRMLQAEVIVAGIAKQLGIPSIVTMIGYSVSSGVKASRKKKIYKLGKIFPLFDRYVYRQCSTLFTEIEGNLYRFYDSVEAYAGFKNACISTNPWYNGAGDAKYVTVRDLVQYEDLEEGLEKKQFGEKVKLVGDLEERYIINSFIERKEIIEKYKKEYEIVGKKIVIIAVPRYAGYDRYQYPYDNYLNNVDKLIRTVREISEVETDILLSIHPKCIEKDYKMFEKKYKCRIIKEPLKEFIGIGSIFLYEELSTTGFWGKMLKIPNFAISSDFSGRDYQENDFSNLKSFIENVYVNVLDLDERDIERVGEMDYYSFLSKVIADT